MNYILSGSSILHLFHFPAATRSLKTTYYKYPMLLLTYYLPIAM